MLWAHPEIQRPSTAIQLDVWKHHVPEQNCTAKTNLQCCELCWPIHSSGSRGLLMWLWFCCCWLHTERLTDIGGITGIAKHFRLKRDPWLTKQQQYHEMLLKCRCLYKKKSFWPEALTISLQKSHPQSLLQWAGVWCRGRETWDALLQDQ